MHVMKECARMTSVWKILFMKVISPEVLGAQGATWRVVVIDLGHRCLLSLWLRLERGRS